MQGNIVVINQALNKKLEQLPNGAYLLQINAGELIREKLILQK